MLKNTFSLIFFSLSFTYLCFASHFAFSWDNFCLSQADLFFLSGGGGKKGSSSLKKEIKRLRKKLRAMEGSRGARARAGRQVEEATINLGNTLLHGKVRMDTDRAAEKIAHYMEGKERNWEFDNCPSQAQMVRPSPPSSSTGSTSTSVRPTPASQGPSPSAPASSIPSAGSQPQEANKGTRPATIIPPVPSDSGVASQFQGGGESSSATPPSAGTAAGSSVVTTNPPVSPSSSETPPIEPRVSEGSSNTGTVTTNSGSQQSGVEESDPPIIMIDDIPPVDSLPPEAPVQRPQSDSTQLLDVDPPSHSAAGSTDGSASSTPGAGNSPSGSRPVRDRPIRPPPSRLNGTNPNQTQVGGNGRGNIEKDEKPKAENPDGSGDGSAVEEAGVEEVEDKKPKSEDEQLMQDFIDSILVPFSSNHNEHSVPLPHFIPALFHLLFPLVQADELCAPWQNPPLSRKFFKSNGRVRAKAFCRTYARNQGDCREHLKTLRKALERVQKADNNIQKLEARLEDLEQAQEDEEFEKMFSDEEETEAKGLCVDCLSDLRGALAPSGWQRLGSGLSLAMGLGLSIGGVREARRSQRQANQLLALQGFPAESAGISPLIGAYAGMPLIAQGFDGLFRDIAPEYVCSPRFYNNPYVYNPYMY